MYSIKRIFVFLIMLAVVWTSQSQTLKIMSFNIRYNPFYQTDGENCWNNRRDAVVNMILQEKPDAIGLQEALLDQLEYLDRHLLDYRRVGVGRDDGLNKGEFMAIYYNVNRLELVSAATRWLSETPLEPSLGWDAACQRTVTIARFRDLKSGNEFAYLNTHFDHIGAEARNNSARLVSVYASCAASDIPVIVGGDMNSTISDSIFNHFYAIGLQDARQVTRRTSHDITYNAFGGAKGAVIDHFFVKGLNVRRFRTLNGNYGVPYISDHYPIEIIIRLNK